jgi:UDP-glucose 4-epimerase
MSVGRCLVLGGAGFMGSHIVELLIEEGLQVRVFDLSAASSNRLAAVAHQVELVEGDLGDPRALADAVRSCDYVYHLASTTTPATSNRDMVFDAETNVVPTLRLLDICVREKVRRIVFSSSGGTIYGDTDSKPIPETHRTEPRSSYGITKLTIEKYLGLFHAIHGLDYTVLRIANCYGPRLPTQGEQGVVGAFLNLVKRGEPIMLWGDGSVRRDYVYVGDVARAFRAALEQQSPFKVFNVGTGVGTSLVELIGLIEQVTGCRARILKEPARPVDVPVNILDPARARQYLRWEARTSLETGLLRTWNWLLHPEEMQRTSTNIA